MAETNSLRDTFDVLGVRIAAAQIPDVIAQMERWMDAPASTRLIAVTGMHGVMEARHDPSFKSVLNSADLVVPDGVPLVWLGRRQGFSLERRVYGPELLESFCAATGAKYRHFFCGGAPGVADRLAHILQQRYGIVVAGTFSPPFRPFSEKEESDMADLLRVTSPHVLWVGLGTPKQECWMHSYKGQLNVPVMVGVGAAFDLISGRLRQAPHWMREHGLEWLFRLLQEPRRLWRRYLIYGTEFLVLLSLDRMGLRRSE